MSEHSNATIFRIGADLAKRLEITRRRDEGENGLIHININSCYSDFQRFSHQRELATFLTKKKKRFSTGSAIEEIKKVITASENHMYEWNL